MKRSEMEKHIELMLEAGGSNHYSYSPRNHAVYILDNLLKLGMLPPPSEYIKSLSYHEYSYLDIKWEPEDV